jgi:hypothetical protein
MAPRKGNRSKKSKSTSSSSSGLPEAGGSGAAGYGDIETGHASNTAASGPMAGPSVDKEATLPSDIASGFATASAGPCEVDTVHNAEALGTSIAVQHTCKAKALWDTMGKRFREFVADEWGDGKSVHLKLETVKRRISQVHCRSCKDRLLDALDQGLSWGEFSLSRNLRLARAKLPAEQPLELELESALEDEPLQTHSLLYAAERYIASSTQKTAADAGDCTLLSSLFATLGGCALPSSMLGPSDLWVFLEALPTHRETVEQHLMELERTDLGGARDWKPQFQHCLSAVELYFQKWLAHMTNTLLQLSQIQSAAFLLANEAEEMEIKRVTEDLWQRYEVCVSALLDHVIRAREMHLRNPAKAATALFICVSGRQEHLESFSAKMCDMRALHDAVLSRMEAVKPLFARVECLMQKWKAHQAEVKQHSAATGGSPAPEMASIDSKARLVAERRLQILELQPHTAGAELINHQGQTEGELAQFIAQWDQELSRARAGLLQRAEEQLNPTVYPQSPAVAQQIKKWVENFKTDWDSIDASRNLQGQVTSKDMAEKMGRIHAIKQQMKLNRDKQMSHMKQMNKGKADVARGAALETNYNLLNLELQIVHQAHLKTKFCLRFFTVKVLFLRHQQIKEFSLRLEARLLVRERQEGLLCGELKAARARLEVILACCVVEDAMNRASEWNASRMERLLLEDEAREAERRRKKGEAEARKRLDRVRGRAAEERARAQDAELEAKKQVEIAHASAQPASQSASVAQEKGSPVSAPLLDLHQSVNFYDEDGFPVCDALPQEDAGFVTISSRSKKLRAKKDRAREKETAERVAAAPKMAKNASVTDQPLMANGGSKEVSGGLPRLNEISVPVPIQNIQVHDGQNSDAGSSEDGIKVPAAAAAEERAEVQATAGAAAPESTYQVPKLALVAPEEEVPEPGSTCSGGGDCAQKDFSAVEAEEAGAGGALHTPASVVGVKLPSGLREDSSAGLSIEFGTVSLTEEHQRNSTNVTGSAQNELSAPALNGTRDGQGGVPAGSQPNPGAGFPPQQQQPVPYGFMPPPPYYGQHMTLPFPAPMAQQPPLVVSGGPANGNEADAAKGQQGQGRPEQQQQHADGDLPYNYPMQPQVGGGYFGGGGVPPFMDGHAHAAAMQQYMMQHGYGVGGVMMPPPFANSNFQSGYMPPYPQQGYPAFAEGGSAYQQDSPSKGPQQQHLQPELPQGDLLPPMPYMPQHPYGAMMPPPMHFMPDPQQMQYMGHGHHFQHHPNQMGYMGGGNTRGGRGRHPQGTGNRGRGSRAPNSRRGKQHQQRSGIPGTDGGVGRGGSPIRNSHGGGRAGATTQQEQQSGSSDSGGSRLAADPTPAEQQQQQQ